MFRTANILDEGGQIALVIDVVVFAVLVVPTLMPSKPRDLHALSLVLGKELLDVLRHLSDELQRLMVEIAGVIGLDRRRILANAGRQEVMGQALASPGGLDE